MTVAIYAICAIGFGFGFSAIVLFFSNKDQ